MSLTTKYYTRQLKFQNSKLNCLIMEENTSFFACTALVIILIMVTEWASSLFLPRLKVISHSKIIYRNILFKTDTKLEWWVQFGHLNYPWNVSIECFLFHDQMFDKSPLICALGNSDLSLTETTILDKTVETK